MEGHFGRRESRSEYRCLYLCSGENETGGGVESDDGQAWTM